MPLEKQPTSITDNQLVNESNPLFKLLFNETAEAIIILRSETYSIIDCNEAALDIFEGNKSGLVGLSFFKLFECEPTEFSRNLFDMNLRKEGKNTKEIAFRSLKQNVFLGQLSNDLFTLNRTEYILLRISKPVDYLRAEEVLTAILRGTAGVTGNKFFKELTRLICRAFGVGYAFIGKISDDKKYLNIVESSNDLNATEIKKHVLENTMFENVIKGYTTFYPKGTWKMFPDDDFAHENKIEGFMGTAIFGNQSEVIGMIGFMDNESIQEVPNSSYILSIFASRAGAEILRIRSKEILKDQLQKLAVSNDAKDKLISILSEDLMDPFHTIVGFSELLRNKLESYDKEKITERVEIIDNSIRNIYFMLDNLTSWSELFGSSVKISRDFILLDEVLSENLFLFKYIIELKDLSISVPDESAITIYCDKKRINSIVRNILSNAVKFTPKGGKIAIRIKKNKSSLQIHVEDNGIGMSSDNLALFDNTDFENPHLVLASQKSLGLGLLLSRSHAACIGGSLQLISTQNKGTTAILTIPQV